MAATGWVYVPASCAAGATCKLHVALHGCLQNSATIGDKFVRNTGYTRWADTNGIIVLFPQTRVDNTARPTSASGSLANGNGCWDWLGWERHKLPAEGGTPKGGPQAAGDPGAQGGGGRGAVAPPAGAGPPRGAGPPTRG